MTNQPFDRMQFNTKYPDLCLRDAISNCMVEMFAAGLRHDQPRWAALMNAQFMLIDALVAVKREAL